MRANQYSAPSTSLPRTLSSQATESSEATTAASSFFALSHSAISARFSALDRPAYLSSCTTAGASDGAGWSSHTASIGAALLVGGIWGRGGADVAQGRHCEAV